VGIFLFTLPMPFIKGLILGFGTAFFLGPVFFTLIKNAVQFGKKAGIWTAVGIIISDLIVITICFYSTASLLEQIKTEPAVKWVGAGILLMLGLKYIINPVLFKANGDDKPRKRDYLGYFTQGVLVNGVNPFVFVVWIGFITIGRNNYQDTSLYIFLIAILVGIFATDILKSFLADKIKPYLKEKTLLVAYRIIGFVLICFSIRLILLALGY
jgi:threonine/homoserine/homoserine lactone efflux protein